MRHDKLVNVHSIVSYSYADATERTTAVGFTSADVGKVAHQVDDDSYWILTGVGPAWKALVTGAVDIPQWNSVLDYDFAALPTSLSEADGPYIIDGVTWTKTGTARHQVGGFGVINGVGMATQPSSAVYLVSTLVPNAPNIYTQIRPLLGTVTSATPLRLTITVPAAGRATNDASPVAAISWRSTSTRSFCYMRHVLTSNPAVASLANGGAVYTPGGDLAGYSSAVASFLACRSTRLTLTNGIGGGHVQFEGAATLAWPIAATAWVPLGHYFIPNTFLNEAGATDMNNLCVEIGANNNGAPLDANGPVRITHLRLEAFY